MSLRIARINNQLIIFGIPSSLSSGLMDVPGSTGLATVFSQALLGGEQGISLVHFVKKKDIDSPNEELIEKLRKQWMITDDVGLLDRQDDEYEMQVMLSLEAARENPKFLVDHYQRAVKYQDLLVNVRAVKAIIDIEKALQLVNNSKPPNNGAMFKLKQKNVTSAIDELTVSVGKGNEHKVKGNIISKAGKPDMAIRHYLDGLVALWPWSASTSMSFELASSSGILTLEQALWGNIAITALKAPIKSGPKRAAWDGIARSACNLLILMRYATNGTLQKAFERLAQIDEREKPDNSRNPNHKAMANILRDKPPGLWAHRRCVVEHVCCSAP
ncbi:uncharacterized protein L203_105974 [Cryptococcus depauperatus CBS 7841]|uniref:Uncharacterized protein n=1 Tax=Cryptococcus depauperatus CBS 7841 TaxID=1295531 RepID=A0A1E3IWX3_9TREE|nr:hypothetical protein L203_00682 [Cryptococcus depauperatus CBS 7841]